MTLRLWSWFNVVWSAFSAWLAYQNFGPKSVIFDAKSRIFTSIRNPNQIFSAPRQKLEFWREKSDFQGNF